MKASTGENQSFTELSVKVSKRLERDLKKAASRDCRSLREEVTYFLETMLAVAYIQPRMPLERAYTDSNELFGQVKVLVPQELYDALFHKAGEYGLKAPMLARVFWKMALEFRKKLEPTTQLLRKEDFVRMIAGQFRKTIIQ